MKDVKNRGCVEIVVVTKRATCKATIDNKKCKEGSIRAIQDARG